MNKDDVENENHLLYFSYNSMNYFQMVTESRYLIHKKIIRLRLFEGNQVIITQSKDELQFVTNHLNIIAKKYKIKISQEIY